MGADEEDTLERLKALCRELLDPKIAEHRGHIVKTASDGILVEFPSVSTRCAVRSRCTRRWPAAIPGSPPRNASTCISAAFAGYPGHYNQLISCCGHLGLIEEAKVFIEARNRVGPPLRASVLRRNLGGFAHCDLFVEGLAKADVPE